MFSRAYLIFSFFVPPTTKVNFVLGLGLFMWPDRWLPTATGAKPLLIHTWKKRGEKASTVLLIFHWSEWLRALHSQLNHLLRMTGPAKGLE